MILYSDFVYYNGTNDPVVNAEVSVYIANTTTLATLFSDVGGTLLKSNPVTTNQSGYFDFYTTAGVYDIYCLGVKQYQISINDATGLPDPLTLDTINCNFLNVNTRGIFGTFTPFVDRMVQAICTSAVGGFFTWNGTIASNINNVGYAFHAVGDSYNLSTFLGEIHTASLLTAPRVLFAKQLANGNIPDAAGSRLGMIQFGSIDTVSNTTPSGALIDAYTDGPWVAGVDTPAYITFKTAPVGSNLMSERMRIQSNGNVLIGTTADTGQKLQVAGDIYASGTVTAGAIAYTDLIVSGNQLFSGGAQFLRANMSDASPANRFSIQTSAATGGTNLDIVPVTGSVSSVNVFQGVNKANTAVLKLATAVGNATLSIGTTGTGVQLGLDIFAGNSVGTTPAIRISALNVVSIGTTTTFAGYRLGVVGNVFVSGDLVVTGAVTAGALSYTSISTTGSLSFTAANAKINLYSPTGVVGTVGDTTFQNGGTDLNTVLNIAPNGTATVSALVLYARSDIANSSFGSITANNTALSILSSVTGTGTLRPFRVLMGTLGQRFGVFIDGNVGVGNPVNDGVNVLQVAGTQTIKPSTLTLPAGYTATVRSLSIMGNTGATSIVQISGFNDTNSQGGAVMLTRNRADLSVPQLDQALGKIMFGSLNSTGAYIGGAEIGAFASSSWVDSINQGSYLSFSTVPNNAISQLERMRITSEGIVLIGATTPTGAAKLQVTGDIVATGSITAGSISYSNIDATGNLTFTATGQFIRGHMTDSVASNRLTVQTTVVDGATLFDLAPNGTAGSSAISMHNRSDKNNCALIRMVCGSSSAQILTTVTGTGTVVPLDLGVTPSTDIRIHTSHNVSIGSTTDNGYKLEVIGSLHCTTLVADNFTLPANPSFTTVTFNNSVESPTANVLDHYEEWSGTLTSVAPNPAVSMPVTATRVGNVVTLNFGTVADFSGTPLFTGLPAAFVPSADRSCSIWVVDGGQPQVGTACMFATGEVRCFAFFNEVFSSAPNNIKPCSVSYTR